MLPMVRSNLMKDLYGKEEFDIGLIFSIGCGENGEEEMIVHHVSLLSTLEDEKSRKGFSNVSSEWFQQQIQIAHQSLTGNVNISGMYLRDSTFKVKERLNDVIALYMRSVEEVSDRSSHVDTANQRYFINLQNDSQEIYVFENGKFKTDVVTSLKENNIDEIKQYIAIIPFYKTFRVAKSIDVLLDEVEGKLQDDFDKNYLWKINKKNNRIECFLNTTTSYQSEEKKLQDETELVDVTLRGTLSGTVLTVSNQSLSDDTLIKKMKSDIIHGLLTRIAFDEDAITKSISGTSMEKTLLNRFYVVDSQSQIVYGDYAEDEKEIGIVDALPSLIGDRSKINVVIAEKEGEIVKTTINKDEEEKPIKAEARTNTSSTTQATTASSDSAFGWFFSFLAFILALFGVKKTVNQ